MSDRTIAGVKVQCTPLPPMRALEIAPEAAIIMAPIIGKLKGLKLNDTIDLAELGPVISASATVLQGGKLMDLAPKLLATTRVLAGDEWVDCDSRENIDRAFSADRMKAMLGAIIFAAEVTFGSFFAEDSKSAGSGKLEVVKK